MSESDHLADFSATLAAYLSALDIIRDCISEACPEVGKVSSERIRKLRTRLSFQPTRDSIRESTHALREELKHYAVNASMHAGRHEMEFERGMSAVQGIVSSLARLNQSSAVHLRASADQLETAAAGQSDKAILAREAAQIRECGEKLTEETACLSHELEEEIAGVEARMKGQQVVDPVCGLLTRAEVLRRIQILEDQQIAHQVLIFTIDENAGHAVLRQVATKLSAQFRHQDLVARWSDREFLVVFRGAAEYAEARMPHVAVFASGRYYDENDQAVDLRVTARMEQRDCAGAGAAPVAYARPGL